MSTQFAKSTYCANFSSKPKQKWGLVEYAILFSLISLVSLAALLLLSTYRVPLFVATVCTGKDQILCADMRIVSQNNLLVIDTVNRTVWCDQMSGSAVTSTEDFLALRHACKGVNKWSQNIMLTRMATPTK